MTRDAVAARLDRYVRDLSAFASLPSIASNAAGIEAAAQWIADALRARGAAVTVHRTPGKPVVVGTIGAGARTVLLYNHYDVQPPGPDAEWTTPAFEPTLREGKLFGRGCIDDKGEIVARLAALDALLDAHGGSLPYRLVFLVDGEEESGSPSLDAFVAAHRNVLAADACIWEAGTRDEHGRPVVWLGVRGLLPVTLHVRTLRHDAHSGWAYALPNAAWRLIEALHTLRDADGNVTVDGFGDGATGPTASQERLVDAMPDEAPAYRAEYGVERFVGGREGVALRAAVFAPTCNLSGFSSGHVGDVRKTITPASATAVLDFRLVPGQDPQACLDALRAHLRRRGFDDVEVSAGKGEAAACSDPDHPFVADVIATLRAAYGAEPVVVPMAGGTGPAAAIVHHLGVPFASVGCSYPGGRKHAPDEHLRLDDFVAGAAAIASLLERYGSGGSSCCSTIASR